MRISLSMVVVSALTMSAPAQVCQPFWSGLASSNPFLPLPSSYFAPVSDLHGQSIFISSPNTAAFPIRRWQSSEWIPHPTTGLTATQVSQFGIGATGVMMLDDGSGLKLYALKSSTLSARWDQDHWTVLAPGFGDEFGTLPISSATINGQTSIYGYHGVPGVGAFFARWNGSGWQDIAQLTGDASTLRIMPDLGAPGSALYLFAGGPFTIAGLASNGFARWDGQTWTCPSQDFRGGWGGNIRFVEFDDGTGKALYTNQGTLISDPTCWIKRWNGQTWSCFANPDVPPFTIAAMNVLEVFDDGRGPALYIGGFFDGVNGHPARNLIRYDGKSWEEVGGGISPIWHSAVIDDPRGTSLFLANDFDLQVSGGVVDDMVLWTGCSTPQCKADCDRSGRLNVRDFACFINAFADRDPYANCDGDKVINVADFACYLNLFRQGCPAR